MDGNVLPKLNEVMQELALQVEGVKKIEKCRLRKSGIGIFLELHVWVDGDMTVRRGHRIGHMVKDHIQSTVPRVLDTVVHLEPTAEKNH